jgi:hypothetical protein
MKKHRFELLSKTIRSFPENNIFQIIAVTILSIPVIATIGQFLNTSYFAKTISVLVFYWPGTAFEIKIRMVAWFIMSLIFISYIAGIAYLFHKKNLGKVVLVTITVFIFSGLIQTVLKQAFGLEETALPDLAGKANSTIFGLWHNPVWEEIVFRGIPLLILLGIEKYIVKKRTDTGVLLYFIIPSVLCGLYHIPGHGLIRFFDTLVISTGFAWMALRFTFFAPLVMHYIADAMMVMNLNKISSIQAVEVPWIIRYGQSLNTFFSMSVLLLIILIPVLILYYYLNLRKSQKIAVPDTY